MTRFGKNSPIGFFDSGVGGLTVLAKVKKLLPKRTHKYIDKVTSKDLGPLIGADKPVIFKQQFAFVLFLLSILYQILSGLKRGFS